ncbi:MAG TPA: ATP-binding protein [Chloroflexota bacterium]
MVVRLRVDEPDAPPAASTLDALQRERALREITQALAVHLDEARVLDLTVQHATSLMSAPYARVWLADGQAGFRCAAAHGFVHPHTTERHLPLDSVSGVAARGDVLNLADAPSHPAWTVSRDFGERTGMRAYLGASIRRAGESLGALEVMRQREQPFGLADEQLLRSLADAVAVAVSNARQAASLRKAQHRLTMLAEASLLLASSFDYEATLREVAALAVPTLADWCTVSMLTETGAVRQVASTYADPGKHEVVRQVRQYAPGPRASSALAQALRSGQSGLHRQVSDAERASIANDPEHARLLCAIGARSMMIVPLMARGRTLGALTLVTSRPDREYDLDDLVLAEDLARRCATAVDNARLYREAQDALRVRDQFLAVAAHELRSPLTRLKSHTEVLLEVLADGQPNVTQLESSLHRMNAAIDRLAVLTTDLLDVSRLRRRMPLRRQTIDLGALVRAVASEHQQHSSTRNRTLLNLPSAPSRVLADPDRIGQVVGNLLDNAAKYSPAGGEIQVSLEMTDAEAILRVRDRGIGLPEGAAERIFEPFSRAANAFAGNIPGLGLGLYICRQIVQRHGGRIWAESAGEGSGTTIHVWLPRFSAKRVRKPG